MLLTEKQSTGLSDFTHFLPKFCSHCLVSLALMNALDQMPAYSPTNAETPSKSVPSIDIEVQKTKGLSAIPSSSGSGTGMSGTGGGYGGYGQHGSNSGGGCCGGRKRRGLALFLDFVPIEVSEFEIYGHFCNKILLEFLLETYLPPIYFSE